MQFAANLSMLFSADTAFADRCRRVVEQGFQSVEILFPYEKPAEQYQSQLEQYGLQSILINTPNQEGDFGYAALPGREKDFKAAFDTALKVSQTLGTKAIHVMAGKFGLESPDDWVNTLYSNIQYALKKDEGTNVVLHLEALNSVDVPTYAYSNPLELLPIIKDLNHRQLGLQFDFYHTLMQGYDLLAVLEKCLPYIKHVQIANPHGRNEPNFKKNPQLLAGLNMLAASKYKGVIGLEYYPSSNFEESLGFLDQYLRQAPTTQ